MPPTQLDVAYRAQRLRLNKIVQAAAARAWVVAETHDQPVFVATVLPLVHAGQAQTVHLVDAYMAEKTRQATGKGQPKGLDPAAYTVEGIRSVPAEEVYTRPFGALGAALQTGAEFVVAKAAGGAALDKLVSTDIQLAQVHSARDWMSDEPRVVGYERITAGGCGLCEAASTQRYHTEDLMPIHEHCRCGVAPIYGDKPLGRIIDPERWTITRDQAEGDLSAANLSRLKAADLKIPERLTVRRDSELGLRLVDDAWAA